MKLRVLMVAMLLAVLFLFTGILYAANGDLIVNGNLGVGTGTTAPTEKAEIKGNMKVDGTITSGGQTVSGNLCVGGNCTSTLHVSGGLYGYCYFNPYSGAVSKSPASFVDYGCVCPAGYALVETGTKPAITVYNSYATSIVHIYACYKD